MASTRVVPFPGMAKVVDEAGGAWQVVLGNEARTPGWCLPAFIHNGDYHYAQLKVFSDGMIDCWDALDLPLFRDKLETGWIAMTVPPGERLSMYKLGSGTVVAFEPLWQLEDVEERVLAAIRHWNPEMNGLLDLEGQDWELRDGVRWAKLPSFEAVPFRSAAAVTAATSELVLGGHTSIFIGTPDAPRLVEWFVYADGTSRLGASGALMQLEDAEREVQDGRAFCEVSDGTWFEMDGLGRAKLTDSFWSTEPDEVVREQRDLLAQLRGQPSAVQQCVKAWEAYEREPSPSKLEVLRERYLAVPKHLRMYCGDMDSKDYPILAALGMKRSR